MFFPPLISTLSLMFSIYHQEHWMENSLCSSSVPLHNQLKIFNSRRDGQCKYPSKSMSIPKPNLTLCSVLRLTDCVLSFHPPCRSSFVQYLMHPQFFDFPLKVFWGTNSQKAPDCKVHFTQVQVRLSELQNPISQMQKLQMLETFP